MGFNLRISDSTPYQRANDQITKQQVDQSSEAGEQSLAGWWTRSQANWDRGAGITWYEPGHTAETADRFHTSQGVDVWTEGTFTLLHDMTNDATAHSVTFSSPIFLATTNLGGDGYVVVSGTSVRRWTPSGSVAATIPGTGSQPALGGGYAWIPCGSGGIVRWDYTTGTKAATITGTASRCWWLKSRLIVASGNSLYEVSPTSSGVLSTVGNLIYTHPDTNFTWVDADATADSILAAGYSGSESVVVAFGVVNDPDTGVPVLNSGKEVARMPNGEQITAMGVYLSGWIVLGTTAGVRVGIVGSNGQVQYGLLSVKTPSAVTDVTFWDRFAYLPVTNAFPDGTSGVVRIDLSQEIGDGTSQFAWAWDVGPGITGTATSVAMVGNTGRPVVAVGLVPFVTNASTFVSTGYLDMGQVRFGTTENKAFMYARCTGNLYNGKAQLLALDKSGGEHSVITYGPSTGIGQDGSIDIPGLTITAWLGFRVRLTPDNTITTDHPAPTAPVISGIGVKALPAPKPARMVQFPLSIFDFETTKDGQDRGFKGRAWYAVQGLEAAQDQAVPLFIQDRRTGEAFVATVESISFTNVAAPDKDKGNFGGVILLQVRMT
jgi:hypothetical protein